LQTLVSVKSGEDNLINNSEKATLILSCPDQKGLVARISQFIFLRGGNIIDLDEHVDNDEKMFFIRVECEMNDFNIPVERFENEFRSFAAGINADWKIKYGRDKARIAIFVSKYDHCLQEILWRHGKNELDAEIPIIISNHDDLREVAGQYKIPFHLFPVTRVNINQSVIRITHKDSLKDLIRKGRDLERLVLAHALELHVNNRVLRHGNKTIIFE